MQRVGWVVMALVISGGVFGLFGPGLFSAVTSGAADAVRADYQRFWRLQSPAALNFRLGADVVDGNGVRLWLSRDYLDGMRVEGVMPELQSVEAGSDRVTYVFAVTRPRQPIVVTFDVEPQRAGVLDGRGGLEGQAEIQFTHFVYP